MASNPLATTTGFVSGIGITFMDGSAADSVGGATVQMADTLFGWTGIPIFQAENAEPLFGNQEAFNNGQTVGVVWGTANNVALLWYSVYNLPANIQGLTNATGSLVVTTTEGLQIVVGGTATFEAAVPVVVNGAIAIDATVALATGAPNVPPSGYEVSTQSVVVYNEGLPVLSKCDIAEDIAKAEQAAKQMKRLSSGEIKKLQQAGFDPHDLKPNSKYDLFKDKNGNIFVKPKDGSGPGDLTDININNLPKP
jgi:hypothetical protein